MDREFRGFPGDNSVSNVSTNPVFELIAGENIIKNSFVSPCEGLAIKATGDIFNPILSTTGVSCTLALGEKSYAVARISNNFLYLEKYSYNRLTNKSELTNSLSIASSVTNNSARIYLSGNNILVTYRGSSNHPFVIVGNKDSFEFNTPVNIYGGAINSGSAWELIKLNFLEDGRLAFTYSVAGYTHYMRVGRITNGQVTFAQTHTSIGTSSGASILVATHEMPGNKILVAYSDQVGYVGGKIVTANVDDTLTPGTYTSVAGSDGISLTSQCCIFKPAVNVEKYYVIHNAGTIPILKYSISGSTITITASSFTLDLINTTVNPIKIKEGKVLISRRGGVVKGDYLSFDGTAEFVSAESLSYPNIQPHGFGSEYTTLMEEDGNLYLFTFPKKNTFFDKQSFLGCALQTNSGNNGDSYSFRTTNNVISIGDLYNKVIKTKNDLPYGITKLPTLTANGRTYTLGNNNLRVNEDFYYAIHTSGSNLYGCLFYFNNAIDAFVVVEEKIISTETSSIALARLYKIANFLIAKVGLSGGTYSYYIINTNNTGFSINTSFTAKQAETGTDSHYPEHQEVYIAENSVDSTKNRVIFYDELAGQYKLIDFSGIRSGQNWYYRKAVKENGKIKIIYHTDTNIYSGALDYSGTFVSEKVTASGYAVNSTRYKNEIVEYSSGTINIYNLTGTKIRSFTVDTGAGINVSSKAHNNYEVGLSSQTALVIAFNTIIVPTSSALKFYNLYSGSLIQSYTWQQILPHTPNTAPTGISITPMGLNILSFAITYTPDSSSYYTASGVLVKIDSRSNVVGLIQNTAPIKGVAKIVTMGIIKQSNTGMPKSIDVNGDISDSGTAILKPLNNEKMMFNFNKL